ncbi:endonuclease I [Bacillus oleivorans]|uniref:Endonuclease I n=1 Tax=Bacillus oleivorans TaxID=1448271 RepID=A0A285CIB9_9BACI|nr:endonuclease [Bacillus oleivorans]SNX66756.1 endonuclease I [Bacillus oleivorans]
MIALTKQQEMKFLSKISNHQRLDQIFSQLARTTTKIKEDQTVYFDEEKNNTAIEQYYENIDFEDSNTSHVISALKHLLQVTHTNQIPYDPIEYVYPWVDLRPDGTLTSIYSGETRQAIEIIQEDFDTSLKRIREIEATANPVHEPIDSLLNKIEKNFKYNCEHVVPQSWFNEQEPMRGDLHHLFTCDPVCNSIRSNFPYYDFADYNPEDFSIKRVKKTCGMAENGLFEPENGKGPAARAMLYFLLRYPDQIEPSFREKVDINLLLAWHQEFPPDLYEKHRNQAIYEIQGNRNPFIDFPEKMREISLLEL